ADVRSFVNGELGETPTSQERRFVRHLSRIDVLLSGSPCQGFSPLNNHTRGRDRRNSLYLRATRLVELAQPASFIFENVPNIINSDPDVVQLSENLLKDNGYEVDGGVVDLSLVGVAQTRKRHVLVGSKSRKISVSATIEK